MTRMLQKINVVLGRNPDDRRIKEPLAMLALQQRQVMPRPTVHMRQKIQQELGMCVPRCSTVARKLTCGTRVAFAVTRRPLMLPLAQVTKTTVPGRRHQNK